MRTLRKKIQRVRSGAGERSRTLEIKTKEKEFGKYLAPSSEKAEGKRL